MYTDSVADVKGTVGQMRKSGKLWIVILGAVIGVGLLVFGSLDLPFGKQQIETKADVGGEQSELEAYRQEIAKEIELLCRRVRGVGEVHVIVTLSGGYEYVYARDEQNKSSGDTYTQEQSYVIVGSGSSQSPLFLMRRQPEIAGIGIVCTGGGDVGVQNELTALVSAALGVGTNKIHVSAAQSD
ncbi:MAG: hypothetical protein IKW24_02215 [Clostridia bacterium]|nr:hypothetical protein [Clostridia bacterium]